MKYIICYQKKKGEVKYVIGVYTWCEKNGEIVLMLNTVDTVDDIPYFCLMDSEELAEHVLGWYKNKINKNHVPLEVRSVIIG